MSHPINLLYIMRIKRIQHSTASNYLPILHSTSENIIESSCILNHKISFNIFLGFFKQAVFCDTVQLLGTKSFVSLGFLSLYQAQIKNTWRRQLSLYSICIDSFLMFYLHERVQYNYYPHSIYIVSTSVFTYQRMYIDCM